MPTEKDTKKPSVFKEEETNSTSINKVENNSSEGGHSKDTGGKTSLGLEPNIAGVICYLFGFISGVILILMEKENRFVRFHAMQSILVFVTLFIATFVVGLIPLIGWMISLLAAPLSLVLWIFMMYKAYQGEWYKLPWIGDIAEKQIDKV